MLTDGFAAKIILSFASLILSILFAKLIIFILENHVKRIASKTKTDIDDKIISALKTPLYISLIVAGATASLNLLIAEYAEFINLAAKILLILVSFWFLSRVASILTFLALKTNIKRDLLNEQTVKNLSKILKLTVLAIGIMFALGEAGIEITPLLASAGILSLAVAFAAQETLSNIISGASLAVSKPFRIGDAVMIDNEYGIVEDMTLRHTIIRIWDNRRVIIPNSILSKEKIINYSIGDPSMVVKVEVGISYESDIDKAMKIMKDCAKKHKDFIPDSEPVVRVIELGDSSVNLRLTCKAKDKPTAFAMACDLRKKIKEEFDKKGIEIPYPRRYVIIEEKRR